MIPLIAYTSTVCILGLYALSRAWNRPRVFDWANAIFFLPLAYCNVTVGAWWAAIISFTFGVIGVIALVKA